MIRENLKRFVLIIITFLLIIFIIEFYTKKENKTYSAYTKIEIPITKYDFGSIKYLDTLTHTFKIKNIGEDLLIIEKVSTDSKYTTFDLYDKVIAPDFETEITARFIAQNLTFGMNTIEIKVEGNFVGGETHLELQGIVTNLE